MTREQVVKLIEKSPIDDQTKRNLLNLIIEEGLSTEVMDAIKEAFDNAVVNTLKQSGIDITQSESFKSAAAEFAQEAEKAKAQLDADMAQIETEMAQVQKDASKQLDDVKAQAIKDKIS